MVCVCAVSIAQEKPEAAEPETAAPVSAIGQEPIRYARPVIQQHIVQIQPQPSAVAVSGPLDNLLKSLTADIAQDNLAIDALRTQVQLLSCILWRRLEFCFSSNTIVHTAKGIRFLVNRRFSDLTDPTHTHTYTHRKSVLCGYAVH